MLSIKDINEVSFRKSNFSGYNSDDVDQFIDEVLETVTALAKENAEIKSRTSDTSSKVAELTAKNTELQEKLSVLAAKIETYREEEEGIKEALLSAQRLGNSAIREAKAKAENIVSEANAKAESLLAEARVKSQSMIENYQVQIDTKKNELESIQREVTAFRSSLYEMYREHIAAIEKLPEFDVPEKKTAPVETVVYTPAPVKEVPTPVVIAEPEEVVIPVPAAQAEEEPIQPTPAVVESSAPTYGKDAYLQEQFDGIGLDLNAYGNIPETLQKEKESMFSTLEFGIEDTAKKKGKFKRK